MPDCQYCGEPFDDEEAYLEHLREAHADELGPIDRRRIAEDDSGGGLGRRWLTVGAPAAVVVAAVAAFLLLSGAGSGGSDGGGPPTPHAVGSVHYHGTVELVIDGERIDLTRPEYVHPRENPAFHFDRVGDTHWHVHARGVTLRYAMSTLGVDVTATSVTFEGTTYRDGGGGTVSVTVNAEPVTPAEYVLRPEDSVRVAVRTG